MTAPSLARELIAQLETIATRFAPPPVARLHIPADAPGNNTPKDAKFCAIELQDGAFGLSYVLLGDTLDALTGAHGRPDGERLAGADPLRLAQRLDAGSPVERALALAAINALTNSVWRQVGYQPPPAGNSLGDVCLGREDHLGMIGFFPSLVRQVQAVGGRISVLELDEAMVQRQRQRFPQVHITLDRAALGGCNKVVGTSTMLLNHTLDAMLAAAPEATEFAVIGPSASLWPDVLFSHGVTLVGGTQVTDGAAFADAMARGESWNIASRKFAIARNLWPGWKRLLA